ncbi:MAG: 50S ribosomal protein L37ae [Candidatus Kariarchaeaceae archaeon]
MTRKTKKVGITGNLGTRYGSTIRKRVRELLTPMKKDHRCPRCRFYRVRRQSVGIWECRKCGYTFTGGSWSPVSDPGRRLLGTLQRIRDEKDKQ